MARDGSGVRKGSASTIAISFTYRGVRCRERIKLAPTPANLKRAAQHRAAILDAISRGTFDYSVTFPDSKNAARFADKKPESQLIECYLEEWLDSLTHLKESTADGYRKIVYHHLIPAIGRYQIADFGIPHIIEFCKGQKVSGKTINNRLSVLRAALADAAQRQIIPLNPILNFEWKTKDKPKKVDDVDPFTTNEQTAILNNLHGQEKNLFLFAFWTGMRTSELIALKWSHVDMERGEITVRTAMTRVAIARKKHAEVPKTKAGKRAVKILPPAKKALEAQRAYTFKPDQDEHVFHNPRTDQHWSGDLTIRNAWIKAIKAAGVRYRRPYQTRHTYASMMLSASESEMWVAQQMGHEDWTMIGRVYGKWIPDARPDAGSRAVTLFGPKLESEETPAPASEQMPETKLKTKKKEKALKEAS